MHRQFKMLLIQWRSAFDLHGRHMALHTSSVVAFQSTCLSSQSSVVLYTTFTDELVVWAHTSIRLEMVFFVMSLLVLQLGACVAVTPHFRMGITINSTGSLEFSLHTF